ncbi:MAG: gephyrin-like molybdotransferase Glp [Cyanobacteria bacterium P01_F01_bin.53]
MFSAIEAERLILSLVTPIEAVETVALDDVTSCLGRVLAAPVTSQLDFPHWDNSAMDGYAVRAQDVQQVPATLQIIEEIPAGQRPIKTVGPLQAARILTGAMMPEGADTVVMQEETERLTSLSQESASAAPVSAEPILSEQNGRGDGRDDSDQVIILRSPKHQSFVRKQGSFSRAGDELLSAHRAIAPAEIALLAAAQCPQVSVYRRPRVAILSTGSELVRPDQALGPGQIVDSNQYALSALIAQTGAIPVPLGIVQDDREGVKRAIALALSQADMVLSSGGVSVGDYDYVDDVLAELGATLHIRAVAVKPGKPLTVAGFQQGRRSANDSAQPSVAGGGESRVGCQLYFGLPGNPASAMVGFWRFVAPAIAKLSGLQGPWSPEFVWATATTDLQAGGRRETYLWGQLVAGESGYEFGRAAGSHSSGNLVNLANTTGLGVVPQGETKIASGSPVRVLKIN